MGTLRPSDYLTALSLFGILFLAVDRWVHKREETEHGLTNQINGPASIKAQFEAAAQLLKAQFEAIEQLRIERATQVNDKLHDLHLRIERLHQAASDEGDRQQVLYFSISERMSKVEADLRAVFSIIDRRDPPPPRSMP